ncbi:hypothetical protein KL942_001697 [Ogataea angusta]|nr:hypothetical protein KL942_001697 [Ogataea angusta]
MQCRNQPGAKAPKIAPKIVHQEQQNELVAVYEQEYWYARRVSLSALARASEWSIQTPRVLEKALAPCSRHYLLATADTRAPFSRRNLANLHSNRLRYLDDQLFG